MSTFPLRYQRTRWPKPGLKRRRSIADFRCADRFPTLIHRRGMAPHQTGCRPIQIFQNTVRQTVIHFHQDTFQQIRQHCLTSSFLRQEAFLIILPRPSPRGEEVDPSRPTQSAQRLIRIFSKESAQREMRPFYSDIVRRVLSEEQSRYKSKPTQAISLIWNLFGRQQAFGTLTRFYLGAVEKLGSNYYPALTGSNALYLAAGVVLHSRVYQRYVRQFWNRESVGIPLRYAYHEKAMTDDLLELPVSGRTLPSRETVEEVVGSQQTEQPSTAPAPAQEVHLSDTDFRALVQGVANSLGRQARLESLRRGGI